MQAFEFFSRIKNNCLIIIFFILIIILEIYLINNNFKFSASFIIIIIFNWIMSFNFNIILYNIILISVLLFNKLCMLSLLMFTWYFKILTVYKILNSDLSLLLLIIINEIWIILLSLIFLYNFKDKFWNIILWILSKDFKIS